MKNNTIISTIKKDVDLSKYSTFKISGTAKYFIELKNSEDIINALKYCDEDNLSYFILGGGSNVLFPDTRYDGLIIKISNENYKFEGNKLKVDAGVKLQDIVFKSADLGFSGLEYLAGIPGSVGGAIRGNAGAYGKEIADVIERVNVIIKSGSKYKLQNLTKEELEFSYRSSIIKEKDYIVIDAILNLCESDRTEIKKIVADIIKERNEKQPYEYPSAGCVFKNIKKNKNSKLKRFEIHSTVPVAKIIEELGFKGKNIGDANVSEKHSNFVVNIGNAKALDVKKLIKKIKDKARTEYGVELEEEIKIVN